MSCSSRCGRGGAGRDAGSLCPFLLSWAALEAVEKYSGAQFFHSIVVIVSGIAVYHAIGWLAHNCRAAGHELTSGLRH